MLTESGRSTEHLNRLRIQLCGNNLCRMTFWLTNVYHLCIMAYMARFGKLSACGKRLEKKGFWQHWRGGWREGETVSAAESMACGAKTGLKPKERECRYPGGQKQ